MIAGVELARPYMVPLGILAGLAYLGYRLARGHIIYSRLIVLENPLTRWVKATYKPRRMLAVLEAVAIILAFLSAASPVVKYEAVVKGEEESRSMLQIEPRPGLVVILDKSGSMGGWKIESVKEAASLLAEEIDPRIDVGFIAFDESIETAVPPTGNRSMTLDAISRIKPGGGTMYTYPLDTAYSWLKVYRDLELPAAVVFLSDGIPADVSAVPYFIELYKRSGITMYTIYTGDSPEGVSLLRKMAEETGGEAYSVNTPEGVLNAFKDIAVKANKTLIEAAAEAKASISVRVTLEKPIGWILAVASLVIAVMASILRYRVTRLAF